MQCPACALPCCDLEHLRRDHAPGDLIGQVVVKPFLAETAPHRLRWFVGVVCDANADLARIEYVDDDGETMTMDELAHAVRAYVPLRGKISPDFSERLFPTDCPACACSLAEFDADAAISHLLFAHHGAARDLTIWRVRWLPCGKEVWSSHRIVKHYAKSNTVQLRNEFTGQCEIVSMSEVRDALAVMWG